MSEVTKNENVPSSHPIGFYFIFLGELAERCCYYGMRAILTLYLIQVMMYEKSQATEIQSYFKAACYLMPLLGGFIADRYLGKYWTIVSFSVFYVIGQFVLCIPQPIFLFIALALLAMGSGVIKPNISTLLGLTYDQQRPGQLKLRTSGFLWFYFSVNVGATISQYGLPRIRDHVLETGGTKQWAYQLAFLFPAVLMVIALTFFALGKRYYAVEKIGQVHDTTPEEKAERKKVVGTLLGVFALMVFFWMAYEQNDNLWVLFAKEHIANVEPGTGKEVCHLNFFGTMQEYAPDGFQFINGLCVLLFIPVMNYGFRWFDPDGTRVRPTTKMLAGFIITALVSGIMAMAAQQSVGGAKVPSWWIVVSYIVLTVGEVLIYGTGLELAFAAAPANMKSFITACFLLTNTGGNLLNAQLSKLYDKVLSPRDFFLMTMVITLSASFAFYFVGKKFSASGSPAA